MTTTPPPHIEESADSTQEDIMQIIRMINSVHVDELKETNFAEWYSVIQDAVVQNDLEWTLDGETNAPETTVNGKNPKF